MTRHGKRTPDERPRVPVFYNTPSDAVDRAIDRLDPDDLDAGAREDVLAHLYDEIQEIAVVYVDGQSLTEYLDATARCGEAE